MKGNSLLNKTKILDMNRPNRTCEKKMTSTEINKKKDPNEQS